jgi:hypothetical protein
VVALAVHGHGAMPPRGGMADLTDAEIRSAIAYMIISGKDPAKLRFAQCLGNANASEARVTSIARKCNQERIASDNPVARSTVVHASRG